MHDGGYACRCTTFSPLQSRGVTRLGKGRLLGLGSGVQRYRQKYVLTQTPLGPAQRLNVRTSTNTQAAVWLAAYRVEPPNNHLHLIPRM